MDDKDEPTLDLPVAEFGIRRTAISDDLVIKLSDSQMAIVESVMALATTAYTNTGRRAIREVVIDQETGYCFGIMPGQAATVPTPVGPVLLRSKP